MTHLEIICRAYDQCGIWYVVKDGEPGWKYLFLVGREEQKQRPLDQLLREHNFMEFQDGAVASY
jgi:hypothetical protein